MRRRPALARRALRYAIVLCSCSLPCTCTSVACGWFLQLLELELEVFVPSRPHFDFALDGAEARADDLDPMTAWPQPQVRRLAARAAELPVDVHRRVAGIHLQPHGDGVAFVAAIVAAVVTATPIV